MPIIDELVLPPDVHIVPVARLEPAMREQLDCAPGHFTVTRRGGRSASSVVDGLTARLLERFRSPATIVEAIVALSQAEDLDPRRTLEESFGVLGGFINDGMLVRAGSELAEPIATTLGTGELVGGMEIVEPVHVVVDTEVYRARTASGDPVAVKIARPGSVQMTGTRIAHEAAVLRGLDGRVNPALLAAGTHNGRPYLAAAWCAGADVMDAAAEARATGATPTLLALVERVLAAFAHVHRQSVLHGDVHPRNVLVDAGGAVTVIDFGLSATPRRPAVATGGVDLFSAPETAAARLAARRPAPQTAAGEQYALAALAHLMVTGAHTHRFSLERDAMLLQLRDEPPTSFADLDVGGMAAVEQTLHRALAKDPDERFGSVAELLGEFRSACSRDLWTRPAAVRRSGAGRRLVDDVLARLSAPGRLYGDGIVAPTASVMNGGAGFAYALLRMAAIRGDERLLGHADLWATQAARHAGTEAGAFTSVDLDLVRETIGERSFYHHAAGVHGVNALVAAAQGDGVRVRSALADFVRVAGEPCPHLDTAFGRSGLLIGCAQLWEAVGHQDGEIGLRALGDALHRSVDEELAGAPAIADGSELTRLGAAHGWAGHLHALLRWAAATRRGPAAGLAARLDQLAELGRPRGRAMYWPADSRAPLLTGALSASWCNGSAGYVPLWTAAHTAFGDERYARLAAAAAWGAHEPAGRGGDDTAPGDLCCGLAGRAYALAAMHRHTGDAVWLARARALAERAVERVHADPMRRDSLYKGEIGVALLVAELGTERPAGLPLYEPEGWPAEHANRPNMGRSPDDGRRPDS